MKILFVASLAAYLGSAGLSLLADTSPVAGEIAPWAQLGTSGVLAWVASLLVGELRAGRVDAGEQRKAHAAQNAALLDDSAKQREEFSATLKASSDRLHEEAAKDRAMVMSIVEKCSASRREVFEADTRRDVGRTPGKPTT